MVAVGAAGVAALLRLLLSRQPKPERSVPTGALLRRELHAFRDRRLWLALGTTATFQAAVFCTFSYLAPLLTDVTHLAAARIPLILLLSGLDRASG